MSSLLLHAPRVRLASLLMAGVAMIAAVQAQTQAPQPETAPAATPPTPGKDKENAGRNQKIERIHIEDRHATVDELRVGGETQNITVKPKNNAPAYQVMPNDDQRNRSQGQPDTSATDSGSRVWWNVFKF